VNLILDGKPAGTAARIEAGGTSRSLLAHGMDRGDRGRFGWPGTGSPWTMSCFVLDRPENLRVLVVSP
jgi:hypothetical protein